MVIRRTSTGKARWMPREPSLTSLGIRARDPCASRPEPAFSGGCHPGSGCEQALQTGVVRVCELCDELVDALDAQACTPGIVGEQAYGGGRDGLCIDPRPGAETDAFKAWFAQICKTPLTPIDGAA